MDFISKLSCLYSVFKTKVRSMILIPYFSDIAILSVIISVNMNETAYNPRNVFDLFQDNSSAPHEHTRAIKPVPGTAGRIYTLISIFTWLKRKHKKI
jgi:hypothetical protein